ncbi:MAG: DUF1501 domain-containing protein [Candidatus Hydrogenedentes bacterium]|nr:DUF1501 domain-containing protein [Candidatus Hydrogenedentota bacterium]
MNTRFARDGVTRRQVLKTGLAAATGCAWGGSEWAVAQQRPLVARAKAVIQIWMWGGPCHLDTFDPKPEAGRDYCGPLNKPIATTTDGLQVGELLPLLAQQADKYTVLRGMTHGVNAHETASYVVQTGRTPGRLVYPGVGAVVSLFKGHEHGYTGIVPPYIVLTELQGRFSEAGFLGQRYKPFATGGDPNRARFVVEGIVAEGITDEHQLARRALLHSLDSLGRALPDNEQFERLDRCEENAYGLMFGAARELFDLSKEDTALRERYGRNTFGQSCLMARRLVEHGVPYITINYKGWDTHKQHFEIMNRKLPELDQGLATLLADLADRGLLDSTIVWWGGEFGRTPRVQWEPPWNGGRGHHGECFCSVVAGGGFKGGRIVGASDARGEEVVERPIHPVDLIGSIYELLGIDPDGPLPNVKGLDVPVLAAVEGVKTGGRLHEIMN